MRVFGARIGRGVKIRPTAKITYPWKVSIGDYSWVGDDAVLYSLGRITIGENAVISQRSYLCTGSHDHTVPTFDIYALPIEIQNEAWIAADVFIAPGVIVGEGTVVGARATVLETLPPRVVCAGSPVRVLGPRVTRG